MFQAPAGRTALAVLLLAAAAVTFAAVAVADWDATWDSFKDLISTS